MAVKKQLTIMQLYNLHNTHVALDGVRMVEDPETKKITRVRDAYLFSNAVKMKDRQNRKRILAALEAFEENRKNIAKRITGSEELPGDGHPKQREFNQAVLPLMQEKIEVKLNTFKIEDFNFHANPSLPLSLIDAFGDLVEEEPDEEDAKPKAVEEQKPAVAEAA